MLWKDAQHNNVKLCIVVMWRSIVIIHLNFRCYCCDYIHELLVLLFFVERTKRQNHSTTILTFIFCMLPISWFIDLSWQVIFIFYSMPPSAHTNTVLIVGFNFFYCFRIFTTNLFGNIQYIFKVFALPGWCFTDRFFSILFLVMQWNLKACLNFHYPRYERVQMKPVIQMVITRRKIRKGSIFNVHNFLMSISAIYEIRYSFRYFFFLLWFMVIASQWRVQRKKKVSEIIIRKFNIPWCTKKQNKIEFNIQ